MKLLAELGADPLLPNEDNTTPLMVAAGVGTYAPGEDPGTEREVLEAVKLALHARRQPQGDRRQGRDRHARRRSEARAVSRPVSRRRRRDASRAGTSRTPKATRRWKSRRASAFDERHPLGPDRSGDQAGDEPCGSADSGRTALRRSTALAPHASRPETLASWPCCTADLPSGARCLLRAFRRRQQLPGDPSPDRWQATDSRSLRLP